MMTRVRGWRSLPCRSLKEWTPSSKTVLTVEILPSVVGRGGIARKLVKCQIELAEVPNHAAADPKGLRHLTVFNQLVERDRAHADIERRFLAAQAAARGGADDQHV